MKRFIHGALAAGAMAVVTGCGSGAPEGPKEGESPAGETAPGESGGGDAAAKAADEDFIGLPIEEARALAEERDLRHRVTWRDGEALPGTADYWPDRVNFEVKNGKVIGVTRG